MVEETIVVVQVLEGRDGGADEGVEVFEVLEEVGWEGEVYGSVGGVGWHCEF